MKPTEHPVPQPKGALSNSWFLCGVEYVVQATQCIVQF